MRRWILAVVVLAVAGIGVTLIARTQRPDWTSESEEAVAALEAANDARMKLYHADAAESLDRALELDPDFVYAKLARLHIPVRMDDELREQYIEDLREADLDQLTHRERCLIQCSLAYREDRRDEVPEILEDCLQTDPDDVFLLHEKAMFHWGRGDLDVAERLFRRVVDLNPNWVIAYNMLGYITMIQQRFVEAREYFVSYRYIAPDQANPHDSLGELYIVQGQWEDARLSFEHAIEIKPDFWASYEHLVIVLSLMDRYDEAQEVIDRMVAEEGHPEKMVPSMRCFVDMWALTQRRADREILELADSGCVDEPYEGFSTIATHQAAVRLGERDRALAIEQGIREMLEKNQSTSKQEWMDQVEAALAHMQGVRLAAESRYDEALERFRDADSLLRYQETGPALLKLHNQLTQVETLLAAGRDVEGHRLLSEVRFINPVMVDEFEERGLRMVGLSRR